MSIENIHWRHGTDPVTFAPLWSLFVPGRIVDVRTKLGPSDVKYFDDEVTTMRERLKECNLTEDEFRLALSEYIILLQTLEEKFKV